jgi:dipeptidase D
MYKHMKVLSSLEPHKVFEYFEEICSIPHGSSNTKKISDYLVTFAREHDLRYIKDQSNNVIIFKDGTPGYEASAPVMLQGHMDMVCEKDKDCNIDFERDGLELVLNDGIISANGTTLGGDDGIAVAYALAILDNSDIPHPPLEAVFTVDEEIGMLGAAAIDCSPLKSKIMLNLDSEDEGYLLVSCAGGVTAASHIPVSFIPAADKTLMSINISGLLGGHSGVEIDKNRANANILFGRILYTLNKKLSFNLVSIEGGLKDNAIVKTAVAVIAVNESDIQTVKDCVSHMEYLFKHEYVVSDPDIKITAEITDTSPAATANDMMDNISTGRVIAALVNMPYGIQGMSSNIEGLVESSLNLGILKTTDTEVVLSYCVRSSIASRKQEMLDKITSLTELLSGYVTLTGDYPAWEYRQDSPLRDLMKDIFTEQYGREPVIQALHAGVECGLFAGKIPDLDCVSFGPDMKDIHTTNESMDVESVKRTWEYTLEILKRLK